MPRRHTPPQRWRLAAVAALLFAVPPGVRADAPAAVAPAAVAAARDAVFPALVNLTVVTETFAGGRAVRILGSGSGVVVSPEGWVLTNYHVAGHAQRITATLTSGEILDARVVVHDPPTDLSILRLELPARRRLAAAALGDSDLLAVGDPVLAMGNPLALASSVSLGIVGNPRRVFTDATGSELAEQELGEGERTGLFTRWIQHDALILPGNSGGPLVDLSGRVVGINELGGAGLGFAIPSNVARRVLDQARAGGRVRRGWLGLAVLPVGKLGRDRGALVASVAPGSPAERAGLEPGDVLLSLAGDPVTVRFLEEVPELYGRVAELAVGREVALEVERGGEPRRLTATVEVMEPSVGEEAEVAGLGVTVQEVTGPMALARGLETDRGVLVTGVRPGGPLEGARPALAAGDLLLSFADRAVDTPADLAAAAGEAETGTVTLGFRRAGEQLVAVVDRGGRERAPFGGELPAAWLGVRTQVVVPELATALGLPEPGGYRLTEVFPWTEASRAGLAVGDVVRALDGTPLAATRTQEREGLRRAVEQRSPGDEVRLTLLREEGGSWVSREVAVVLEPAPEEATAADRYRQDDLELAVRDVTFLDRIERRWTREQGGVVVEAVEPGSWAHLAGLRLGDLILEVSGDEVADADAFAAVMERVLAARPEVIPLLLRRGRRTHFVFIEPDTAEVTP